MIFFRKRQTTTLVSRQITYFFSGFCWTVCKIGAWNWMRLKWQYRLSSQNWGLKARITGPHLSQLLLWYSQVKKKLNFKGWELNKLGNSKSIGITQLTAAWHFIKTAGTGANLLYVTHLCHRLHRDRKNDYIKKLKY